MELWKDITGYEGLYQVSNLGRVKSLDRQVKSKNGSIAAKKGKLLKQTKRTKGYLCVNLSSNGKSKCIEVQRLVALEFLPNYSGKPCVNHKDENKENNCYQNLEWVTYKENNEYGSRIEKASKARINGKLSKKVYQYTLDGTLINEYPSVAEVKRIHSYDSAKISLCCLGKRKTAYSYKWSYERM